MGRGTRGTVRSKATTFDAPKILTEAEEHLRFAAKVVEHSVLSGSDDTHTHTP